MVHIKAAITGTDGAAIDTNVVAYCLMPTHYHLLVRVNKTSEFLKNSEVSENSGFYSSEVSGGMMRLSVSYTKAINKRFERVGSLFQGQFQSKVVKRYSHLLNLCAYIHTNPVKDGLAAVPEDWLYSNYLEWLGQRKGALVDPEFIQEHFNSPDEYREFITGYLKSRKLPDEVNLYLQSLED